MNVAKLSVREILDRIDPASLTYDDWLRVGMALHDAGEDASTWDQWSQRDPERYKPGDCEYRWRGFGRSSSSPKVTLATLSYLAKLKPEPRLQETSHEPISPEEFIGEIPFWRLNKPADLHRHFVWILENAFEAGEKINIVIPGKDGKPDSKGITKTREEWLEFRQFHEAALKSANGMFIRINPVDGNGVGNENVTAFRHMLIESDDAPLDQQIEAFSDLPVTALVYSGKSSIHAWVRLDAKNAQEFQELARKITGIVQARVPIDQNTKNPSRLSRCPGFLRRNGVVSPQAIVKVGKGTTAAQFLEKQDGLPDILVGVNLGEKCLPKLSAELIHGALRHGHKLMLAGPSKSGKSFALISLALAVANGSEWFGQKAEKGKVLYVNLEIDPASCMHRFHSVAQALGYPEFQPNLSIWNLRGHIHEPRRFVEAIKRRADSLKPDLMIIDPIYVLNDGDEIKANDVKRLLSLLDEAAMSLTTIPSIAFSHHFPKGDMAVRDAKDRSSGSGVFARHPDAICTLTPLDHEDTYRVEWILREFASPHPSIWQWTYPVHRFIDYSDFKSSGPIRKKGEGTKKKRSADAKQFMEEHDWETTVEDLASHLGVSQRTVYRIAKELNCHVEDGKITRNPD